MHSPAAQKSTPYSPVTRIPRMHTTLPRPARTAKALPAHEAGAQEGPAAAPSDIGYINAHGTSTPLGDKAETLAVKAVFGGRESAPPMSSTKSATGHLMGAGGLTEAIACIKAIEEGVLPPTLHLAKPVRKRSGLCAEYRAQGGNQRCNEQFARLRRTEFQPDCCQIREIIPI